MNTINALIIDDEQKGRELLKVMLESYCKQVTILGTADSVKNGFEQINHLHPDLVFLDIEMKDGTGFDLLEKFKEINFVVVFVTAFDKYAIKAFKFSALDYILKPVDKNELINAVNKYERNNLDSQNNRLKLANSNYKNKNYETPKIAISTQKGLILLEINDIVRFRAEGGYTWIYLNGKKEVLATKNLGEFEEYLRDENFIRVHHSHLINIDYIRSYEKGRGGVVIMTDGAEIEVSQRKKQDFLSKFKKI